MSSDEKRLLIDLIAVSLSTSRFENEKNEGVRKDTVLLIPSIQLNSQPGMWHSGSASALHAESPGFDSPHLQAVFEWSRVRLTLGALLALIAQW